MIIRLRWEACRGVQLECGRQDGHDGDGLPSGRWGCCTMETADGNAAARGRAASISARATPPSENPINRLFTIYRKAVVYDGDCPIRIDGKMIRLVNQEVISWSLPNYPEVINQDVGLSQLRVELILRYPSGLILLTGGETDSSQTLRLEMGFYVNSAVSVERLSCEAVQKSLEDDKLTISTVCTGNEHTEASKIY